MYFLLKSAVSGLVIGTITVVAKISPKFGGIIAALPLISLLSLIWLYVQGGKTAELSEFLFGVLYGLPSTIGLIAIVAFALKYSMPLFLSIGLGILGWGLLLFVQKLLLPN
ncbi:hypothetical protein [Tumebacillus lipolyticus]|uniref:DUF3147 family protein n=1 Tax=Tumebacillus lipolyticus TaxID=1280370 RepID=A0ABW4ZY02_9BACL